MSASVLTWCDFDNLLFADPLTFMEDGLDLSGEMIPAEPSRKDSIFRRIYGLLADEYGFSAEDILPRSPITDDTYFNVLRSIPEACVQQGVAKVALTGFIDRITEVAALLHSQQMTFSRDNTGSSLMPRNVTYGGTVLDLDTAGEFTRSAEDHIEQDCSEMVLTIAAMRRLFSNEPLDYLPGQVWSSYCDNLNSFSTDALWTQRVERTLASSDRFKTMKDLL